MAKKHRFDHKKFFVSPKKKLKLSKISTSAGDELDGKKIASDVLAADVTALTEAQEVLYASGSDSLLIIFQGMDAAGKDSTIRHVIGAVNPQGCRVTSFKAPSDEEVEHHFLWRPMKHLPKRGMMAIFNRSYYEEVLVVRVHPKFLDSQRLPDYKSHKELWMQRFEDIRQFEEHLTRNKTHVLKFFLHVSRDEQKARFLERLENPEKHWKFNPRDLDERQLWDSYQEAFEEALTATSTEVCPWYVIPMDSKWYGRAAIADIIAAKLEDLRLKYPKVTKQQKATFAEHATQLRSET